jgi:predicted kinase
MTGTLADKFYNSKAWRRCRDGFMRSKYYICERCGGIASIAHHKNPITAGNINDPSVTLSWDNLEAVCHDCHQTELSNGGATVAGTHFDADGNIIVPVKKVFLISGCYGSGKSHYVRTHMTAGDLVVDMDAIYQALSYQPTHTAPEALLSVCWDTRDYLYSLIRRRIGNWKTAWVIEALANKQKRNARTLELNAENIHIDTDMDTCIERIKNDNTRPDKVTHIELARRYFEGYEA